MKGLIMGTMLTLGALAAEGAEVALDDAQIDGLLTGNTVYIDLPTGGPGGPEGGVAPFLYGSDGRAAARLPAGPTLTGTWTIDGGRYCVDWENGPKHSCTRLVKSSAAIILIDADMGQARGTVQKIVPGNPENL
jgi:hypothetical protein